MKTLFVAMRGGKLSDSQSTTLILDLWPESASSEEDGTHAVNRTAERSKAIRRMSCGCCREKQEDVRSILVFDSVEYVVTTRGTNSGEMEGVDGPTTTITPL
jgi:hypothetical protein